MKLEEQFDFMKNFNKEVRERNKARKLKVYPARIRKYKRPKTKQIRTDSYSFILNII